MHVQNSLVNFFWRSSELECFGKCLQCILEHVFGYSFGTCFYTFLGNFMNNAFKNVSGKYFWVFFFGNCFRTPSPIQKFLSVVFWKLSLDPLWTCVSKCHQEVFGIFFKHFICYWFENNFKNCYTDFSLFISQAFFQIFFSKLVLFFVFNLAIWRFLQKYSAFFGQVFFSNCLWKFLDQCLLGFDRKFLWDLFQHFNFNHQPLDRCVRLLNSVSWFVFNLSRFEF